MISTEKRRKNMIDHQKILQTLANYDTKNIRIGMVASHSALDSCDGAVDEGFQTIAVCQKGREKTYADYFKAFRDPQGKLYRGVVDEAMVLNRFSDIKFKENMDYLKKKNLIFIPNRSFTSYVDMDWIENHFDIPMFGNRELLRIEERGEEHDYYWLLEKAGLPFPKKITDPKDINSLSIIKLHHAQKKLERGFFTASSYEEYKEKARILLDQGTITQENLDGARMEEYIIGPVFNFDYFSSPLETEGNPIELLGVDWRFETSLDGHVRLPAPQQMTLRPDQLLPEYTVCGHNSCTARESLLEKVFVLAEKYVAAVKKEYDSEVIGPFCLQTCVDKDLNFHIYDVAPRIGGGTNVHLSVGHPYGNTLWRKPMSTGRRIAMEIRRGVETDQLEKIVS
jgi:5-formaminoimidazole-4-carboxamide-1-(beta)-D-ribofuranosyl 5'-monophosphate synthetase